MSEPNATIPESEATIATHATPPHHPVLPDIARGIVVGDFASSMGPAGAVTQIVVGFIPGVGTLAACRDLVADWRKRDVTGLVLNGGTLIPGLGGFTKTAEVMSKVAFAGEAFVVVRQTEQRRAFADGRFDHIPANHPARWSALAAFLSPLPVFILTALVLFHILPLVALWGVFALPALAIIFGAWGKHRARRLHKATPGLQIKPGSLMAGAGVALGWLGVFLLGLLALGVVAADSAGALAFLK
jgi:hypothetical protein